MATYKQIIELQAKTAKAAKAIDRFVRQAEQKIAGLELVLEGKTAKGAARKRPLSSEERKNTEKQILAEKVLIGLRQEAADVQRLGNKVATAALNNQLKINAATERQKNLLKALKRAGVSGGRAEEVEELKKVAAANSKNAGILNQTNNALVKILETQREITRSDVAQDRIARKNAAGKQFDIRVKQLKAVGASQEALKKIEDERFKLADLNASKQTDLAKRQLAIVEELIQAQEELNKATLQPKRQAASPIRGSKTLAGSPIAQEAADKKRLKALRQLSAEEERLNRFAAAGRKLKEGAARAEAKRAAEKKRELDELDKQEQRLNKFAEDGRKLREKAERAAAQRRKEELARLDKEENDINKALDKRRKLREDLARKARNEAKAVAKQRSQKFTDVATGVGFPLLFGGGPGAAIGGLAGGAVGGFGGSIIASAIGSQFDKLGESAKRLVDSLNDPISLLGELSNSGFIVSDALRTQVEALQDQGLVLDATNLALQEFANKVGKNTIQELQKFDKATDELRQELAKTALIIFTDFVPAITAIANGLKGALQALTGPTTQRLAASADPVAFARAESFARQQTQGSLFGGDPSAYQDILTAESQKILDANTNSVLSPTQQKELAKQQQRSLDIQNLELQLLKDKLNIVKTSGKLTDESTYLAKQQLIINQTQLDIEKAGNNTHQKNIALANESIQLAELKRERQKEITAEFEKQYKLAQQQAQFLANQLGITEQDEINQGASLRIDQSRLILAQNKNDLTKKAVYEAQKEIIQQQYYADLQKEVNGELAENQALVRRTTALQNLNNQVQTTSNQKIAQQTNLSSALLKEQVKSLRIRLSYNKLLFEESDHLKLTNDQITTIFNKEKQILENQRASDLLNSKSEAQTKEINMLYNARIQNLEDALSLEKQTNEERINAIKLQTDLNAIQQGQKLSGIKTNIQSNIRNIQSSISNPFGGFEAENQALLIEQMERRESMETRIANEIEIQNAIKEKGDKNAQAAAVVKIKQLKEERLLYQNLYPELERYEQMQLKAKRVVELMQPAMQGLQQGIGDMITALIDGTESVEEAMSKMLSNIGKAFVDMAAEIIVQQVAMIVYQSILKALGGPSFGDYGTGAEKPLTSGMDYSSAFSSGGFGISPKANGGPVNRNSTYLVGENGPELFRPTQAGRIDSNSDLRSAMSRQRSNAPAMNFSFETTNIGGTEYVSREQLEAAMAVTRKQAASDGAKRGMNMTLDKMQHSPATRRRVGI